jgi:predicted dinucleotide-binding enzyme
MSGGSLGKKERNMSTIAIIGLGNMGKGLADRLAGKTKLVLGTSDPAAAADFGSKHDAAVTSHEEAAAQADIVILALPYDAALKFASSRALKDKVVVDITNPVTPDYSGLKVSGSTSAAEEIQKAAPASKVVKAFNTIFAGLFAAPRASTEKVPVFVAGNDEAAVAEVAKLVELAGFKAEKVGALDGARLVEPVGMLNIRFGYGLGKGTNIAPAWLDVAA